MQGLNTPYISLPLLYSASFFFPVANFLPFSINQCIFLRHTYSPSPVSQTLTYAHSQITLVCAHKLILMYSHSPFVHHFLFSFLFPIVFCSLAVQVLFMSIDSSVSILVLNNLPLGAHMSPAASVSSHPMTCHTHV